MPNPAIQMIRDATLCNKLTCVPLFWAGPVSFSLLTFVANHIQMLRFYIHDVLQTCSDSQYILRVASSLARNQCHQVLRYLAFCAGNTSLLILFANENCWTNTSANSAQLFLEPKYEGQEVYSTKYTWNAQ